MNTPVGRLEKHYLQHKNYMLQDESIPKIRYVWEHLLVRSVQTDQEVRTRCAVQLSDFNTLVFHTF